MESISNLNTSVSSKKWTEVIRPKTGLFELNLKEVWDYRDLLFLLVRRDFVANFKQTILGPLWFFIQPLLTTITFMVIFGRIANIGTGSIPPLIFYLSGITLWTYFADCLTKTSTVFRDNAGIFGKVYFPRLIMPLSIVSSSLLKFAVQIFLLFCIWIYYFLQPNSIIQPNWILLLLPLLVVIMAMLGLGTGIIISSWTNKYRDLAMLISFAVQLLMYATPVIYPLSSIPRNYQRLIGLNPMTHIIEAFRYGLTGEGVLSWSGLAYDVVFTLIVLFLGVIIFNKIEKSFMDTV